MTQPRPILCSNCNGPLPWNSFSTDHLSHCPRCRAGYSGVLFPALLREPVAGSIGEIILANDESACFNHPQKKAVVACSYCGRFLCSLCDVDFGGRHLCPACIEIGVENKKIENLENRRTLYDDLALSLAVLPVLFLIGIYFTFITAPMALIIAIRHWNSPSSIIPRTKIRMVLAILFSLIEIGVWIVVIYYLVSQARR